MDKINEINEINEIEYLGYLYECRLKQAENKLIKEENIEYTYMDIDFNERFLQAIWNEQHLREKLCTEEGYQLKVCQSGIWNNSAGPDFRDAIIMLNGQIKTGDIEIHKNSSDWLRHGHDTDERYDHVILHVVWNNDMPELRRNLPTLLVSKFIQPDWKKLLWELEESRYSYSRQIHPGDCALRWAMTEDNRVCTLLTSAGMARFSAKVGGVNRQIQAKGERNALVESILDVLGYKKNRNQFQELYAILDKEDLFSDKLDRLDKEALIFGTSNLLPDATQSKLLPGMKAYVDELWDRWWKLGQKARMTLAWDNSEARPYNRAWRRVAAAIMILEKTSFAPEKWLEEIGQKSQSPKELLKNMEQLEGHESQWREMIDFGHKIKPAADLVGKSRHLDLVSNAYLPYLAAKGELAGKTHIVDLCRQVYSELPCSQNNRSLKEATLRFFMPPSRAKDLVKNYCQQQGLLDIYKNFCLMLDNDCSKCPFTSK